MHQVDLNGPDADQVQRKRHQEWRSFSRRLCRSCLQHHVFSHQVRFPVLAVAGEVCECPCREVKA